MKNLILVATLLAGSAIFSSAFAQTATPKVTDRQVGEQQRIKQGRRSGEVTRGENAKLEAEQAKIQHDKKKAKADGVVTPAEHAKLNHEQRKASRDIYRTKHNARTRN